MSKIDMTGADTHDIALLKRARDLIAGRMEHCPYLSPAERALVDTIDERLHTKGDLPPLDTTVIAQEMALKHREDHDYLPQDRREAYSWEPHHWVTAAMRAYAAQFKKADDAGDTRRLQWLATFWGGQRRDFSLHVLARGSTGDLSDIRTFVDDEMRTALSQPPVQGSQS